MYWPPTAIYWPSMYMRNHGVLPRNEKFTQSYPSLRKRESMEPFSSPTQPLLKHRIDQNSTTIPYYFLCVASVAQSSPPDLYPPHFKSLAPVLFRIYPFMLLLRKSSKRQTIVLTHEAASHWNRNGKHWTRMNVSWRRRVILESNRMWKTRDWSWFQPSCGYSSSNRNGIHAKMNGSWS